MNNPKVTRYMNYLQIKNITVLIYAVSVFSTEAGMALVDRIEASPPSIQSRTYAIKAPIADLREGMLSSYQPQYATICHTILEREAVADPVTDDMFRLLDQLISEAQLRNLSAHATKKEAIDALHEIDKLLIAHGFIYPPVGRTPLLRDGLTPYDIDETGLAEIRQSSHNKRRSTYFSTHSTGPFRSVDCDIASFLYLGIADALELPLFLVEAPEHNFVRWYFSDETYLNWETMDGEMRTDADYKRDYIISEELIQGGVYLSKMTREDTLGYCHFIVGVALEQKKQWKQALKEYLLATHLYSRSASPWNNIAWVMVTARDSSVRNGKEALKFALKATNINRSANNLDTLGCAYAEAGLFEEAITIEEEAYEISLKQIYATTLEGFRHRKTWIEQNPD